MRHRHRNDGVLRLQGLVQILLCVIFIASQTACVSTGPRKLSRGEANEIRQGEEIRITLKDGRKLQTRFFGADGTGIDTEQGRFAHDEIRYLQVERFSAGETVARSMALYVVVGAVISYLVGQAIEDAFERHED